jgi:hypothetical protein
VSDNLLDQADALMRRRSFVAGTKTGNAESDEKAGLAADGALEDLPVLTEVVSDAVVAHYAQPQDDTSGKLESEASVTLRIELAVRQRIDQLLIERQALLTREIEAWLDEQMPQLVIRAMDGITDHLVALLANRTKDELLPRLEAALQPLDTAETDADSAE